MVHSTAPVFGGGGNWVGDRRLSIWKSPEEGVVLVNNTRKTEKFQLR